MDRQREAEKLRMQQQVLQVQQHLQQKKEEQEAREQQQQLLWEQQRQQRKEEQLQRQQEQLLREQQLQQRPEEQVVREQIADAHRSKTTFFFPTDKFEELGIGLPGGSPQFKNYPQQYFAVLEKSWIQPFVKLPKRPDR